MMLKDGKESFLKAHYDWLVACVGVLALAAAVCFYMSGGLFGAEDEESEGGYASRPPSNVGVDAVDMTAFQSATNKLRYADMKANLKVPSEERESFIASERRVRCVCGKVIPGGQGGDFECPFCKTKPFAEEVTVLDADKDGLPDEWEKKYGLNPNNRDDALADADGDGFTNAQEYEAKTSPIDPKDHPDYMQYFKLVQPVRQTYMPVVFRKANKIPTGWRLEFFDPKRRDDYGRVGTTLTAVIGEEIADTGYTVKDYVPKTDKVPIPGTDGLTKAVDVSEAIVVRKRDGKEISMRIQNGKKLKFTAVDVEATVQFTLNGTKSFTVVANSEFTLFGLTFKAKTVAVSDKEAKVVLEEKLSGKLHTLQCTLE